MGREEKKIGIGADSLSFVSYRIEYLISDKKCIIEIC